MRSVRFYVLCLLAVADLHLLWISSSSFGFEWRFILFSCPTRSCRAWPGSVESELDRFPSGHMNGVKLAENWRMTVVGLRRANELLIWKYRWTGSLDRLIIAPPERPSAGRLSWSIQSLPVIDQLNSPSSSYRRNAWMAKSDQHSPSAWFEMGIILIHVWFLFKAQLRA